MALPKFTLTHKHLVSKKLSCLDNVFVSDSLYDHLIECEAYLDRQPVSTNHFPIVTKLDLTLEKAKETLRRSFTNTNWEKFDKLLTEKLKMLSTEVIETIAEFDARLDALTKAILDTIEAVVPYARITSYCKQWWTKELSELRAQRFNLGYQASRREDTPKDPIHQELELASKLYKLALENAKAKCWNDFINTAEAKALWNAYKWMRGQEENAGNAQIPTLRATAPNGSTTLFLTNEEKSAALYQTFFPTPPPIDEIFEVIRELKPNKAPGPDGIPNCVFVNNAAALVPHLLPIYQATFRLKYYPETWKKSATTVLQKPGRPDYTVTKAYRPIALLNVISKILSACVANRLNTIVETHNLLPAHHFGGRAGRTTTDSMHLLHKFVKDAWRRKKVVAGLFLDLGIPSAIVNWTARKLEGRGTTMKFDDFESKPFEIRHGIDQGCPLSCIFYLIYNSDLIKVAQSTRGELAVGYIDDVAFLAEGVDFTQANAKLKRMMERKGGALEWAQTHTSDFALEKTALVQFNRYLRVDPRPVTIGGVEVKPEPATLGGIEEGHEMGTHVTYAADIWWEPTGKKGQGKKRTGAVGFTKHLQSAQRIVALAITGALRTAPTDTGKPPSRGPTRGHSLDSPATSQDQRQNKNAQKIQDSPLDDPETASQHRSQPGQLRDQPSIQHPTPGPQAAQSLRRARGTDEAIADESTLKPTVKIFSDGSMVGGNVGAAAVLIREGKEEVVARKYVGSDREHEVYEAEVVGLILGLELLARERGAGERFSH
ncbi:Reverse transcriptase (RNA-dependent DNA polymerase) [Rhizoctonia solani]|uniref:Reverse transcriptase (RNA-dependent DNA polymerase) n=1 Tax=Rhizoctonia solani TaxID=456999 RepID=A0A8H7M110_9AGAM|nr:Reverse transcriptase (RNA-dependent DNA polymerase) [Rhizoctonia solani]